MRDGAANKLRDDEAYVRRETRNLRGDCMRKNRLEERRDRQTSRVEIRKIYTMKEKIIESA